MHFVCTLAYQVIAQNVFISIVFCVELVLKYILQRIQEIVRRYSVCEICRRYC